MVTADGLLLAGDEEGLSRLVTGGDFKLPKKKSEKSSRQ